MIEEFISLFKTDLYLKIWGYILATWPIWLPILMIWLFLNTWLSYKRRAWMREKGSILLEIKLPREIARSPAAMEVVLSGLSDSTVGSLTDVFVDGRLREWLSLEMVSFGGEVKFFIWAFPRSKKNIEARIYAQYPDAEIFEVEDYATKVIFDLNKIDIWGCTTKLNKADPYPIKTYIDYELDKSGKEQEEIVDPIAPLLEHLGSLKPGEQAWVQIMIQAHRAEGLKDARIFTKPDWQENIKKEIKNIIEKESFVKPTKQTPDKSGAIPFMTFLTNTQNKTIEAIERNAGKPAFDTMIRIVYLAPKEVFNKTTAYGILGAIRQFGSQNLNGIRPDWMTNMDYPWVDFRGAVMRRWKKTLLEAYKRRSFFNIPFKHLHGNPFILTAEELATVFHFPGRAITTPTLSRVPSKKATAPSNLPVRHLEDENVAPGAPN